MGEVSEWLEEAVKKAEQRRKEPRGFRVVVQVLPSKIEDVSAELRRIGIKIIGTVSNFIFVDVDTMADVERISKIDGVVYVSKEKFFVPMAFGLDELFQRIGIMRDPILKHLTMGDLTKLGFKFKPAAEIPNPIKALIENANVLRTLITNPTKITQYLKWEFPFGLPVLARADWRLVTFTRELLGVPRDNRLSTKTYTAVIDSGVRYGPGLGSPAEIKTISFTLYPEPPVDCMSHGSWTHACSFGKPAMARYGSFYPVANAPRSLHVKVFTGFGGCTSYQLMKAMEIAAAKYGAKVVSMSLGGLLTENIVNDPECKLLDQLTEQYGTVWVVAAGNAGPGKWQVASPGAALKALTVAAHEASSEYTTSSYSSRGWSGKFYEKHPDIFEEHYAKWGDEFLKPDCCAPGGDKIQIVSAASLWYDGLMDFIPDGWEGMVGTSMACPHIAGLVALAIDRGLLPQNVDKIKDILRKNPEKWIFGGEVMDSKSIEQGWGIFHWDRSKEIGGV